MAEFVHLHVHSEYSLLDGACRIKELAGAVKDLGQTAVAVTDHGNLFAAVAFYNACLEEGIKPIIGCEVYISEGSRREKDRLNPTYHLTLLCKDNRGYQNLSRLVTKGYTEGFYTVPRIDFELLREYHEGLIALSADLDGEVAHRLLISDYGGARSAAMRYRELFGEDYYLEISSHDNAVHRKVFSQLIRLSQDTGIPLCAANNVHYIKPEDCYAQRILTCINTGHTIDEKDKNQLLSNDYYLRSSEQMKELFSGCPDAVKNTVKIANRCNVTFEFGVTKLPYFSMDGVEDNTKFLRDMAINGLRGRYRTITARHTDRLEYELSVIERMGFVDYFLIVWDFVHYAKTHDIPVGCGRGSGAGSLVAYSIGITDIDPLRYNLIFERFLNPERVSMPDFDIDFCTRKRQRVIDYVISRYGSDHVAQIITFGTLGAKQALRDCARVMGLSHRTGDTAARAVFRNMSLAESLEKSNEFKRLYNSDPQIRQITDAAMKIENLPRNVGTHAAGVVITKDPVYEYVPLFYRDGTFLTQYTMTTLESLGLLKMDFLAVSHLTIIDDCVKSVQKKEPKFNLSQIPLDDSAVYKMLSQGKTQGIFQLESAGMASVIMRLKPENIEDVIAVISLYRPGPMDSIPTYIRNRHNPSLVTYKHPLLKNILDVTYGCIVYQEQVMQIFRELAGYSFGRADIVRRAMAKKKHDVLENERRAFIYGDGECCGAIEKGVPENVANELFDEMISFASYAFNKSHAAAYATIAYQSAYLKCHYYKEYMAALLSMTSIEKPHKLGDYINDVIHSGLKIYPIDINKSHADFTVQNDGLRFGLLMIKGLSENFIEQLEKERMTGGEFTTFQSFCRRMTDKGLTLKVCEALIQSGALDSFPNNRREMLISSERVLKEAQLKAKSSVDGQLDFFGGVSDLAGEEPLPEAADYSYRDKLRFEYKVTGLYLSGHPLDEILPYAKASGCMTADCFDESGSYALKNDMPMSMVLMVADRRIYKTKNGELMCFLQCEDKSGMCEVIVFPSLYNVSQPFLRKEGLLYIEGRLSLKDNEPKLIAGAIQTAEGFVHECRKKDICVRIRSDEVMKMSQISELAEKYSLNGGGKLIVFLSDKRVSISLRAVSGVAMERDFIMELQRIAGTENVLFRR